MTAPWGGSWMPQAEKGSPGNFVRTRNEQYPEICVELSDNDVRRIQYSVHKNRIFWLQDPTFAVSCNRHLARRVVNPESRAHPV